MIREGLAVFHYMDDPGLRRWGARFRPRPWAIRFRRAGVLVRLQSGRPWPANILPALDKFTLKKENPPPKSKFFFSARAKSRLFNGFLRSQSSVNVKIRRR